ncbi:hypothetical protein Lfu02_14260 [Longispora fulva]|uniref:Knr4/Smi1-like domain-containing protein n=1 Tax=Longispora fulva TaxID=619741 RepID=A0A8J7GX20_9ACTN|nr:SMI1/KNR4 family protein [Longispora fulva]MBG6140564.1 hypothetical protein [Longispora fulva]GIG57054.1 hypothetical protein Lfu02_14260 [Longispora fulva]
MQIIHPGSPVLRIRYRQGVFVAPTGLPDWLLYARVIVELPATPDDLTRDELRVLRVLAANEAMVAAGDPLWEFTRADYAARTPPGWTWAHLRGGQLALVPADLHGSYRHIGGMNLTRGTAPGRGLLGEAVEQRVPTRVAERVSEAAMTSVEDHLGYQLPPRYRAFLLDTNGAGPTEPAVHAEHGFVLDQPLFGLARPDRQQDLVYANAWLADRFTPDFLAIGYVQGGMLAVRARGEDADSIWYFDDDDPRDDQAFTAAEVSASLLSRIADSVDDLWTELTLPPTDLVDAVDEWTRAGLVREVRQPAQGGWLPASMRAPWQTDGTVGEGADLLALFDAGVV